MNVLVVEDDGNLALSVAASLRGDGHHVELASNGAAALQLARERTIDAVLLDLGLPDVDGYELIRTLRGQGLAAASSIIAFSEGPVQLERADAAGADLALQKPVQFDHLGSLVEFITRRRRELLRWPRATPDSGPR